MNAHINNVSTAINHLIDGEPLPSFKSVEFALIMLAINELTEPSSENLIHRSLAFEELGRRAIETLLNRISASMNAEREIAIIKDKEIPLC